MSSLVRAFGTDPCVVARRASRPASRSIFQVSKRGSTRGASVVPAARRAATTRVRSDRLAARAARSRKEWSLMGEAAPAVARGRWAGGRRPTVGARGVGPCAAYLVVPSHTAVIGPQLQLVWQA